VKKPEEIAKVTDFVPVGDDSIVDDNGITNRWAIRRRNRERALEDQRRQDEENFIE